MTKNRQMRTIGSLFNTRETSDDEKKELFIEGYFAVFDGVYEIAQSLTESVDPHAFDKAISGDVRALIDHDSKLVIGRTTASTLKLKVDSHGLFGSILINPNDQDAMNIYARVQRGDVNQCSFGFEITSEDTDIKEDGSIHWTIKEVNLFEVSICTFPAYETTNVKARSDDAEKIRARSLEAWKLRMVKNHGWLKGDEK